MVTLEFGKFANGGTLRNTTDGEKYNGGENGNNEKVTNTRNVYNNDNVEKHKKGGIATESVDRIITNQEHKGHSFSKRSTSSSILDEYPPVLYEGKPSKVSLAVQEKSKGYWSDVQPRFKIWERKGPWGWCALGVCKS